MLIDKELKSCKDCPFCMYFDKDVHGKGKHEIACWFNGSLGNILYGDQLSPNTCSVFTLEEDYLEAHTNQIIDKVEAEFTKYLPLRDKTGAGFYAKLNKIRGRYKDAD